MTLRLPFMLITAIIAVLLRPTGLPAQEPAPAAPVDAAAGWLVDQLVGGTHLEGQFGPQYGPTADVALGLLASRRQPTVLPDVLAYLARPESVDTYVHGGDFDGKQVDDPTYVGANAKLGFLVTTAGLDPRDVGGDDLVEGMLSLEQPNGAFEDRSDFGSFANVLGQSFAVLFLAEAEGVAPSADSIQYLLDAQCPGGGFPQDFGQDTCTPSVDATGLAIQALVTAAPGSFGAAIDDAVAYLLATRNDDGSWSSGATGGKARPNVNSTAYAAMGLLAAGEEITASRDFLASVQNPDGGLPISPGDPSNAFATAQALPVLAGTNLVTPTVGRLAGQSRVQTAIEISRAGFADDAADAVVLARSDLFADALAGTPLAVAVGGPLLTTDPSGLDDAVLAEIQRVLPRGGDVLVLGGPDALPFTVDERLEQAGFVPERVAGATRYHTSVEIAEELGDPDLQLLTTGQEFADALTAGTAAGAVGGAVLLTDGTAAHPVVSAYLAAHDGDRFAVGGPAATAHPDATPLVGENREATAVLVAEAFFETPPVVGVARLDMFADALAGGAHIARREGPLLLTTTTALPAVTGKALCRLGPTMRRATVFGGPVAVSDEVVATVGQRILGTGC